LHAPTGARYAQQGRSIHEGMRREWYNEFLRSSPKGTQAALRKAKEHGDFRDI
jgi:hypothetical protein